MGPKLARLDKKLKLYKEEMQQEKYEKKINKSCLLINLFFDLTRSFHNELHVKTLLSFGTDECVGVQPELN